MTSNRGADPRRRLMHAAVASGGAAAALMHFSIVCEDEAEIRAGGDECLEPILRAALLLIEAAGILPGEEDRAGLAAAIRDYVDAPERGPGRCRICGCTEDHACVDVAAPGGEVRNCAWADPSFTLCDNPECLQRAAAGAELVQ